MRNIVELKRTADAIVDPLNLKPATQAAVVRRIVELVCSAQREAVEYAKQEANEHGIGLSFH